LQDIEEERRIEVRFVA